MKNKAAGEGGFIRTVILIVIALLVISYFGINLRSLVSSPTTQDNVSYVASTTVNVWNGYLKVPATYLWNEVFVNLIWKPAIAGLKNAEWKSPTLFSSSTPVLSAPVLVE